MLPRFVKGVPISILPVEGMLDVPFPGQKQEATEHPAFRWKPLPPKHQRWRGCYSGFMKVPGRSLLVATPTDLGAKPSGPLLFGGDIPDVMSPVRLLSVMSRYPSLYEGERDSLHPLFVPLSSEKDWVGARWSTAPPPEHGEEETVQTLSSVSSPP